MTQYATSPRTAWVFEGIDGDGGPVRFSIGEGEISASGRGYVVGRHPDLCHLALADPGLSKRHCRFTIAGDALRIEDLNSLNGTLLDDADLPAFSPQPVADGQAIGLGRIRVRMTRTALQPS